MKNIAMFERDKLSAITSFGSGHVQGSRCVCVCVYARAHISALSCLAVSPVITIILSFFFEISYCKDVPLRSLMRTTNQLYHPLDIYAIWAINIFFVSGGGWVGVGPI